jgi:zinc protease
MDIYGAPGTLVASVKSERKHIGDVLGLVGEIINKPSFDQKEFEIIQKREIDDYEEVRQDPQRVGFHELDRMKNPWPKESIHYVSSFEEKIKQLKEMTSSKVKESFDKCFNSRNIDASIVGDADGEILARFLETGFNHSTKQNPYQRIEKGFLANIEKEAIIDTPDKEMAVVAMAANFSMRDDHEDYAAMKFANYLFGENMNSRLLNRVRETEGLSYNAGSFLEISSKDDFASFNMYAICAPQNAKKARDYMKEELQKIISDGVNLDEVKAGKESMQLSYQNMLANDHFLAHALSADLEVGRDFYHREKNIKKISQLSCERLLEIFSKWWGQYKFSEVIAGDKNKI